jgi:purine-nucleoside phosphorylase
MPLPSDDLPERVVAAVRAIRERTALVPEVAITLGSGLGGLVEALSDAVAIPTARIPHWPPSTVLGHLGRLALGEWSGRPVAMLAGRSHRYEGYTLDQVTFGVRVMHALGARTMIFTNAVGAIDPSLRPGDLMLATDHLNAIGRRGLLISEERTERRLGRAVGAPYGARLAAALAAAAARANVPLATGVLYGSLGPSYETAAEIRMAAGMGASAACMSTVHEATVAAHLGCETASLSCVANRATGLADRPLTHDEVVAAAGKAASRLRAVLAEWLRPPEGVGQRPSRGGER